VEKENKIEVKLATAASLVKWLLERTFLSGDTPDWTR